jgi:copper chaperone CopZ
MSRTILTIATLSLTALAGCSSSTNTVGFAVDGMACANCAGEVAHHLEAVPGVTSATVNFNKKWATVNLDPDQPASMGALQSAVADWKKEHMGTVEDPGCLDPEARKKLAEQGK